MKKENPWPVLENTFDPGPTGSAWPWIFWWARHSNPPSNLSGIPHSSLSDIERRKFYRRTFQYAMSEVEVEADLLPWGKHA